MKGPTGGRITRSCDYGTELQSDGKMARAASLSRLDGATNFEGASQSGEDGVVEGFLCPICKCDLGRPDYLQVHFERNHASAVDDQSLLNGSFDLRSMISRAKSKVLRSLDDSILSASFELPGGEQRVTHRQSETNPQRQGERARPLLLVSRSRTKMFVSFRDLRSAYRASRSQQILFRLNRLTSLDVTGANKRRVLERHITPWADDRDIDRCPNCAQSFGLLRRKHHCRLCGFVICNQCSLFLSVNFALEFLQAVRDKEEDSEDLQSASGSADSVDLKRVDSLVSVNSITGADPARFIRVCGDCRQILRERYEWLQDQQIANASLLPVFYRQLSCAVRTLQSIKTNSFATPAGMTQPQPPAETVVTSQPTDPSEISVLAERQLSIEMDKIYSCIMKIDAVLKDQSSCAESGLTGIKRKIAEALKSYGILAIHDSFTWRGKLEGRGAPKAERRSVPVRSAVEAFEAKQRVPETDPILEQIAQVRKFIEVAKNGQRYDEVWALEANLRELELMLRNIRAR